MTFKLPVVLIENKTIGLIWRLSGGPAGPKIVRLRVPLICSKKSYCNTLSVFMAVNLFKNTL